MAANESKTPPVQIFIAWFVVSLPAALGVYYTLLNALKLFQ
jgi:membrane protein insertase Oxa1/YidC/SpoIIIJ